MAGHAEEPAPLSPAFDNRFTLVARLIERQPLRHTPAGIPLLEGVLKSESQQVEASQPRRVEIEVKSVAAGDIAHQLANTPLDAPHRFSGFLAHRGRSGKALVFHITAFERFDLKG